MASGGFDSKTDCKEESKESKRRSKESRRRAEEADPFGLDELLCLGEDNKAAKRARYANGF